MLNFVRGQQVLTSVLARSRSARCLWLAAGLTEAGELRSSDRARACRHC